MDELAEVVAAAIQAALMKGQIPRTLHEVAVVSSVRIAPGDSLMVTHVDVGLHGRHVRRRHFTVTVVEGLEHEEV